MKPDIDWEICLKINIELFDVVSIAYRTASKSYVQLLLESYNVAKWKSLIL